MEVYLDVMRSVVKPWLDAGNYVWLQDSALSHKAKKSQEWGEANLSSFYPWMIWLLSLPDCNSLDYGMLGVMEAKACANIHTSLAGLKSVVETGVGRDARRLNRQGVQGLPWSCGSHGGDKGF